MEKIKKKLIINSIILVILAAMFSFTTMAYIHMVVNEIDGISVTEQTEEFRPKQIIYTSIRYFNMNSKKSPASKSLI